MKPHLIIKLPKVEAVPSSTARCGHADGSDEGLGHELRPAVAQAPHLLLLLTRQHVGQSSKTRAEGDRRLAPRPGRHTNDSAEDGS